MLSRLSIRDIVLIDQLDLEFSRGLTILTGETGAGKSILLDSLSLALGARGDGGLVRHGQTQGQVTAVFEIPEGHRAIELLKEQDIAFDGELILRRVQVADRVTEEHQVGARTAAQAIQRLLDRNGMGDFRAPVHGDLGRRADLAVQSTDNE